MIEGPGHSRGGEIVVTDTAPFWRWRFARPAALDVDADRVYGGAISPPPAGETWVHALLPNLRQWWMPLGKAPVVITRLGRP
jgi:hypothetical protein